MSDDLVAWATVGVTFVVVVALLILLLLFWRRNPAPQQARRAKFERRDGDVELPGADADAVLHRANTQISQEEATSAAARAAALRRARNSASEHERRDEAVSATRRQVADGPSESAVVVREDQVRGTVQAGAFFAGVDTANGAIQNPDLGAIGEVPRPHNDSQSISPESYGIDGETQS